MSEEFVKPPKRSSGKEEFVAPPKKTEHDDFVAPPKIAESQKENFVKPPSHSEDFVSPPKNKSSFSSGSASTETPPGDPYDNPSYFGTPKVGIRFYLTGYLFIMLYLAFQYYGFQFWFLLAYTLLSNYTYSWFADYQRYKQGSFAWFFTPYGSLKTGWESSRFMNHQTATVSKGMFGSYKISSRTSISETLLTFIIGVVMTEVLKFMIVVPIAFISIFTHKSTIRKYNEAVDRKN